MSRSKRKSPFCGMTTADSEKYDKRKANRRLRNKTRRLLDKDLTDDDLILPEIKDVSNVWLFQKDGKQHISKDSKEMRK